MTSISGSLFTFKINSCSISDRFPRCDFDTWSSSGRVLGDRNYWSPTLAERLCQHELHLLAPFSSRKREKAPWPTWLKHKRYRIETVIGQLVERFNAKRVWARDLWHFCSRWWRRVLSHTFAVYLCRQNNISSLRFADLLID
jgi:hypothetical protein